LQHDPETQERTERLKVRLLEHPQVVESSVALWNALRRALQASLVDPDGAVRERLCTELAGFGVQLRDDEELRRRLDGTAADVAVFGVSRYGAQETRLIINTSS